MNSLSNVGFKVYVSLKTEKGLKTKNIIQCNGQYATPLQKAPVIVKVLKQPLWIPFN